MFVEINSALYFFFFFVWGKKKETTFECLAGAIYKDDLISYKIWQTPGMQEAFFCSLISGLCGNIIVNDITKPKMLPPRYRWLLVYSNARILPQDLIKKTFRARHLCVLHPLICMLIQIYTNISFFSLLKSEDQILKTLEIWHLFSWVFLTI